MFVSENYFCDLYDFVLAMRKTIHSVIARLAKGKANNPTHLSLRGLCPKQSKNKSAQNANPFDLF